MGRDARLEARSVRFERGGRCVLELDSLTVAEGAIVVVRGRNGAGKSTLLRGMAGLETPVSGTIDVFGHPAGSSEARRRTAFAPQTPVFFRGSVRYNLELPGALGGNGVPDAVRLAATADLLGITPLLERPATELSGGEAQRANVARALLARAPLTLLDEPLAGMDDGLRGDLLRRIVEAHRAESRTLIVASHEPDEDELADVVLRLP